LQGACVEFRKKINAKALQSVEQIKLMLNIQENIILAPYTSFKIGGPAKYFVEAQNKDEISEAIKYAAEKKLPYFILGGGSNILVSDKGFDGLAIRIKADKISVDEKQKLIEIDSGASLAGLVKQAAEAGLSGMEWAAGIPGTLGGAVRGNARAFGDDMASVTESVEFLDVSHMQIKNFKKEQCEFNYWGSIFKKDPNLIVLSAKIKLQSGKKEEIAQKNREIINKRINAQPQGSPSAGSFFLNPIVADEKLRKEFEQEKGIKCIDDKIPAGWLIDQIGFRGKKVGGAMISEKHGNFLVNAGGATAEDIIMLSSIIKQKIRQKFNIQLESEVKLVGF